MAKKSGKKKSGKKKSSQGQRNTVNVVEQPAQNEQLAPNDASIEIGDDSTDLTATQMEKQSTMKGEGLDDPIVSTETDFGEQIVQLEEREPQQLIDGGDNVEQELDIHEEPSVPVADFQVSVEDASHGSENYDSSKEVEPQQVVDQTPTQVEDHSPIVEHAHQQQSEVPEFEQESMIHEKRQPDTEPVGETHAEYEQEPTTVIELKEVNGPVLELHPEPVVAPTDEHVQSLDNYVESEIIATQPLDAEPQMGPEVSLIENYLSEEPIFESDSMENNDISAPIESIPEQKPQIIEHEIEPVAIQNEQQYGNEFQIDSTFPEANEPIQNDDAMFWEESTNAIGKEESFDFLDESNNNEMTWDNQPQLTQEMDESIPIEPSNIIMKEPLQKLKISQNSEHGNISDSFLENDTVDPSTESGKFWNDEGNKDEMPWDQVNSNKYYASDIAHSDSLLNIAETENDNSFFEKLSEEVQNKMQVETEQSQTKPESEDKFGFLEEDDDDILADIMDDDLLDSDDDLEISNCPTESNVEGNTTVNYNPSPEKFNSNISYNDSKQKPNPYMLPSVSQIPTISSNFQTSPRNSFLGNERLGINSFLHQQSQQPQQQYNTEAAEIHKKLEEEKKKSDAYDFPTDLISKHTRKAPTATQNVYTTIESTLAKQEPVMSNFAIPPKFGTQNNTPLSQKNSRSGSITKSSFFSELPIHPKNVAKPAPVRNPYEAIEKSPIPQHVNLDNTGLPVQNLLPPVVKAKRNPYAPPSNSTVVQQPMASSYVQQVNNIAPSNVPQLSIPTPNQSHNQHQYKPPPTLTANGSRNSSTTKQSNPYAPAEVGGHIRRISQDPTPVDLNPNLISVPLASPITGQHPPVNRFGQPQVNQFSQPPVNQFGKPPSNTLNQSPVVANQSVSPVSQYAPSSSGNMNHSFTFPDSGNNNKYAPVNQQQGSTNSMRRSTRVGRPSISSINEVYGSNIVTSNATSTSYKKKSVMPPGGTNKSKHAGSNSIAIAPAPAVINPENLNRRQWPLFDFSAENFMSMIPVPSAYGTSTCSFQINNFKTILKDSSLAYSFPGPLNKNKSKRKEISKWLDDKIADLTSENLDDLLVNEEQLLWNVLKLLVDNINKKGDFTNLDYQSSLLKLLNPTLSDVNNTKRDVFDILSVRNITMSINPVIPANAHRLDQNLLTTIHGLLEKGQKASALEFALSMGDWTLSMLIANLISPLAFNQMLKLYTTVNYGDNHMSNDLNFFLQSTGSDGMGMDSLVGKESWIVDNFLTMIPFILKNRPNAGVSLLNIGESLIKSGYHVYGKIAILISGEPLVPTCNDMLPTSIDDMMIDEIYEYVLMSSDNMPAQFINGLPHMVPVKIRHAGYLADFGLVNEAHKYISSTQVDISSKLLFVEPSTAIAQQNITDRLSKLGSSWLVGISRPKLDKVWNTLDKSFTKFVSGEGNTESRKHDDGMFSKFTSPSVSRTGSHLDLSQVQIGMEHSNKPLSTIDSVSSVTSIYGAQSRQPVSLVSTPNTFNTANPYFTTSNGGSPSVAKSPQRNIGSAMRQQSVTGLATSKPRGKYAPPSVIEKSNDQMMPPPNPSFSTGSVQSSPLQNNVSLAQVKNNIPLPRTKESPGQRFGQLTFDDNQPANPPKINKNESPYGTFHAESSENSSEHPISSETGPSPYGSHVHLNAESAEMDVNSTTETLPFKQDVTEIKGQVIKNFEKDVEPDSFDETYEEDLESSIVEEEVQQLVEKEKEITIDKSTPQPEEIKTIVSPVESVISEASTSSNPPVVVRGPSINRYAPQSTIKKKLSGNPYAPKSTTTKSTKSAYAPKEPLKPLPQSDDPLEAMGITSDVDMFAATGYQMPPPPHHVPEQPEPESNEVEISKPINEEAVVDLPIPMMHKSPIPMIPMTAPKQEISHLTDIFEPPKVPTFDSDEQYRKSPIYTITDEKKFYAEDTGEYYDDIIDDDDDDQSQTEAEAERLRLEAEHTRKEEEERRKKQEEEERKKKETSEGSTSRSWFGMFGAGSNNKNEKKVYKAKLGEDNSFYYDEKLKRWINGKESIEAQVSANKPPPPPPVSSVKKPSPLNSTPPVGPPIGSNGPPVSKVNSIKTGDSIDDLLNRPSPGVSASRKSKRGPRRGYVDVMAQP